MHICVYLCIGISLYVYLYMCISICIYLHIYIYIHIHTYIHGEVERHIVQAAIRQLTTDHSLGRLGVDFTKGVTHLVITLVRPGLT